MCSFIFSGRSLYCQWLVSLQRALDSCFLNHVRFKIQVLFWLPLIGIQWSWQCKWSACGFSDDNYYWLCWSDPEKSDCDKSKRVFFQYQSIECDFCNYCRFFVCFIDSLLCICKTIGMGIIHVVIVVQFDRGWNAFFFC